MAHQADQRPDGDPSRNAGKSLPLRARRKGQPRTPTVALLVDANTAARSALAACLHRSGLLCDHAASLAEARELIAAQPLRHDVVVSAALLPDGDGRSLLLPESGDAAGQVLVLIDHSATIDDAVAALRAGAADLIAGWAPDAEVAQRIQAAARRGARNRETAREMLRLKRACRRLSDSRKRIAAQVDALCTDLADAYQELADHMQHTAAHAEFAAALRHELDVESLLRSSLEYILRQTGPTNAAVFLPSNHCDFSLGAYVNYDVPKDSADVLLDHLADALAPRFQHQTRVQRFDRRRPLEAALGDQANWLDEDASALVFTCRAEGECLAVGLLFRDASRPFTDEQALTIQTVSEIFGEQLGRVIKIHHRLKPGKAFPHFEQDEDDLAA